MKKLQKQKLLARLSLEHIVLETDSPVLGPDPAGRNEPANLTVPLQAVDEAFGCSREEAARATTENARALFGHDF